MIIAEHKPVSSRYLSHVIDLGRLRSIDLIDWLDFLEWCDSSHWMCDFVVLILFLDDFETRHGGCSVEADLYIEIFCLEVDAYYRIWNADFNADIVHHPCLDFNSPWMTCNWLQFVKTHRLEYVSQALILRIPFFAILFFHVEAQLSVCLQLLLKLLINMLGVNKEIKPFLGCFIQMLDNIICQLESQAGYFVHSGVFVCDVGFVDYQNS